jgi:hypothetical protein
LSAEGKAISKDGLKIGALAWARGADFLTTQACASEESDAYALAIILLTAVASLVTHRSRLER